MAPPRHAFLVSSGDVPIRRRSSCSADSAELHKLINEAFMEVDKNGNGLLDKDEIRTFVTKLIPLSDPIHDTDSICAAMDIDGDGQIDLAEFHNFIASTVHHHKLMGRTLVVEDVLRDAFSQTLSKSKKSRELIVEAFMRSKSEVPEADDLFHRGWVNKIFDEFYSAPPDPSAPKYQCQRMDYLKSALSFVSQDPSPPESPHLNRRKSTCSVPISPLLLPAVQSTSNSTTENKIPPLHPYHTSRCQSTASTISSKSFESSSSNVFSGSSSTPTGVFQPLSVKAAPSEHSYRTFCAKWLEKIEVLEQSNTKTDIVG